MDQTQKSKKRLRTDDSSKTAEVAPVQIPGAPATKYATHPEFMGVLLRMKAEQVPIADGRIFVAQRTDKVTEVWKGLVKHNFLSVPVLQKTGSKYYGFVDMADIVRFFVQHFGESKLNLCEDFWALVEKEESFQTKTVNDIMVYPLQRRNPFHPVARGYSLFAVVEALAREKGLHRVPIVDENRRLVHMVTQSQLVAFLSKHMEKLGDIRNKPAGNFTGQVISVNENSVTMEAFNTMVNHNVSGLAVVNDAGKLVGNISLRDLKAVSYDGRLFWRLYQTVKHFIEKIKSDYQEKHHRPKGVVFATEDETLESIIGKLADHNIHRIFVVDSNKEPIGVVSLKDVLYEVISNF